MPDDLQKLELHALNTCHRGYRLHWSAVAGPIAGVMIADYYLHRRRVLDVSALYSVDVNGPYWFKVRFCLPISQAIVS